MAKIESPVGAGLGLLDPSADKNPQPQKGKPFKVPVEVAREWERLERGLSEQQRLGGGNFDRNLNYYYGHFDRQDHDRGTERPATNYTFPAVELRTGLLTEAMGRINVLPVTPDASSKATFAQVLLDALRNESEFMFARSLSIKNMCIHGVGVIRFEYDELEKKVVARAIDPRSFVISPGALDIRQAAWVGYFRHVPIEVALARWPELEGKVIPGRWQGVKSVDLEAPRQSGPSAETRLFTSTSADGAISDVARTSDKELLIDSVESGLVTVLQIYVRIPKGDGKRGFKWAVRNIVNNVMVEEEDSVIDEPPYVAYRMYADTSTFWTPGLVDFIAGAQKSANIRHWLLLSWIDRNVRRSLMVDRNSNMSTHFNKEDGILEIQYSQIGGAQKPQFDNPQDVPASFFSMLQFEHSLIDDIAGNQDVMQGRRPTGIQTGEALKVLSENAHARIRAEARNVAFADKRASWILLKIALRTMKGKAIRISEEVLMDEDTGERLQAEGLVQEGGFTKVPSTQELKLDAFDIDMDMQLLIPRDRQERAQTWWNLFQAQLMDGEDLLERLDVEGRKDLIEKLRARQDAEIEFAKQQEAQLAQMGQGGAPAQGGI